MASPNTIFGTDMPSLADELARLLRQPHGEPFKRDLIILDGKASANWLSHYLVRSAKVSESPKVVGLGIHMNAKLVNTQLFHQEIARMIRGENPVSDETDGMSSLTCRIFEKLYAGRKGFSYLTDGAHDQDKAMILWEASARIADWIKELNLNDTSWCKAVKTGQRGNLEELWREISAEMGTETALLTPSDVLLALESGTNVESVASHLPGRIFLFATGEVPQTVLDILKALSPKVQVNALFLQPTEGYFLDLRNEIKDLSGPKRIPKESSPLIENPGALLLVQTGKHHAAMMKRLIDDDFWCPLGQSGESLTDVDQDRLLDRLKASISHFEAKVSPKPYVGDNSLTLHRCHNALREAEAVRDQLMAILAEDPSLSAGDILILTPDPDTYAPLLSGVLGGTTPVFSFGTAAVEGAHQSPLGALAQKLLALPAGRLTSQEFLDLCGQKIIRDLNHWDEDSLYSIRQWMFDAPFFWGASSTHRESVVQITTDQWSLDYFMRSLALGTAMADDATVCGSPEAMPIAGIKGITDFRHVAGLLDLAENIKQWVEFSNEQHSLEEWTAQFGELLLSLIPEQDSYGPTEVDAEKALSSIKQDGVKAGSTQLDSSTFAAIALNYFDLSKTKGQFLSGRTTLAPLRASSIHPAKVIALVGMADGKFPPGNKPHGKELKTAIATSALPYREQSEQRGMHAIMQVITAAQSHLIITYQGYAGETGKDAPAAMPVEILRQTCEKLSTGFKTHRHAPLSMQAGETMDIERKALHIDQSETYDRISAALAKIPVIEEEAMPKIEVDTNHWPLDAWISFWSDPVRHALESFNVKPARKDEELASDEVLSINHGRGKKPNEITKLMERWVKRFNKTRGRLPANDKEATFSGVVPADGGEEYANILASINNEADGVLTNFDEQVTDYHKSARRINIPTSAFEAAYLADNCLILCVSKNKIAETDLIKGLATLGWIRQNGDHKAVESVAVIGPRAGYNENGSPKRNGLGAKPRIAELTGKAVDELLSKMTLLGRSAVTPGFFLGYSTTKSAIIGALGTSGKGASLTDLDDGRGRGDIAKEGHALLVNPSKYDFEAMNKAVSEALGAFQRYTAKDISGMITPPLTKDEPVAPEKKKPRASKKPKTQESQENE